MSKPHVRTPARVILRARLIRIALGVGVAAAFLFLIGSQFDGGLSSIERAFCLHVSIVMLAVCMVAAFVQWRALPRQLEEANDALMRLSEKERERLVEDARAAMEKNRHALDRVESLPVWTFFGKRPALLYVLFGVPAFTMLMGLIYVGLFNLDTEAAREFERFFWRGKREFISLAQVLVVLSIPGAILLMMSTSRVTHRFAQHQSERYYKLVHENNSGDVAGGLSLTQDVEEGGLSLSDEARSQASRSSPSHKKRE